MKIMKNTKKRIMSKKSVIVNPSPALLQFYIKTSLKQTQTSLAAMFEVSSGAISRAIKNDPLMQQLRDKIINLINSKL